MVIDYFSSFKKGLTRRLLELKIKSLKIRNRKNNFKKNLIVFLIFFGFTIY